MKAPHETVEIVTMKRLFAIGNGSKQKWSDLISTIYTSDSHHVSPLLAATSPRYLSKKNCSFKTNEQTKRKHNNGK